jgi:hypothetical protein
MSARKTLLDAVETALEAALPATVPVHRGRQRPAVGAKICNIVPQREAVTLEDLAGGAERRLSLSIQLRTTDAPGDVVLDPLIETVEAAMAAAETAAKATVQCLFTEQGIDWATEEMDLEYAGADVLYEIVYHT